MARLPHFLFEYLDGGSYDEVTLRRNVEDLQAIALRQRVLRDVSAIDLTKALFGREWAMPVGLGPVGLAGMYARRGEVQTARAAAAANVPFALSTVGGRYLDALTYNYYTYDFDTARIDQMYQWSGGTPFIMSEFHYAEPSHGLITGVRFADDELSQGEMYRNYVEKAAATGEVIGTNWFLAVDQATTGRWYEGYNGETGGIGLLDVTDRPYKTLLQQMMTTNYEIYDVMLGNRAPYTYTFSPAQGERNSNNTTDIPLASVGEITVDGQLDATWPDGPTLEVNDSGRVLGIAKQGLQADYRLAWDAENLYVYADVSDDTPEVNTQTGWNVWNGDAIEMFIGPNNVDQGGSIQAADTQLIIKGAPETAGGTTPEVHWYNHNENTQPDVDAAIVLTDHGDKIPEAVDYLRRVVNAASRMDRLIQDVLAFARVSRQEIDVAPVNVEKLVRDLVDERPELHPPRAEVTVSRHCTHSPAPGRALGSRCQDRASSSLIASATGTASSPIGARSGSTTWSRRDIRSRDGPNGWLRASSWNTITANAQMSVRSDAGSRRHCSGAIQSGVPPRID